MIRASRFILLDAAITTRQTHGMSCVCLVMFAASGSVSLEARIIEVMTRQTHDIGCFSFCSCSLYCCCCYFCCHCHSCCRCYGCCYCYCCCCRPYGGCHVAVLLLSLLLLCCSLDMAMQDCSLRITWTCPIRLLSLGPQLIIMHSFTSWRIR